MKMGNGSKSGALRGVRSISSATLLLIAFVTSVGASDLPPYDNGTSVAEALNFCIDRNPSQIAIGDCVDGVLSKATDRLLVAESRVQEWIDETFTFSSQFRSDAEAANNKASSTWRNSMAATCELVGATWSNGSGRGLAVALCKAEETDARALQLLEIIE